MRRLTLSLALLLLFPALLPAGEKIYLTRTLDLDFKHPGRVLKVGENGAKPVDEKVLANAYILVLAPKVTLKLTIANDNPDEEHYRIRVNISDEDGDAGKVSELLKPDRVVNMFWLAKYRYQFTFIRKHVSPEGRFVSAVVKLDVYVPEE
ncbi:MAG TPA: hypothetical protein VMX57_05920 [Planctomycetota bacterium]|nr:hypothetical protein [Planctomycetota bacterium]